MSIRTGDKDKSMVADAGGDPTKVKTVTIGFNAVQNLIAGKVAAAVGFWNAEGVQLQAKEPTKVFKLDEFGAPAYPELVAFTRNDTISKNPALICAFTKATVDGYTQAAANPEQALDNLTKQAEGLALSDAKAQYDALKTIYQADAPVYGTLDLEVLPTAGRRPGQAVRVPWRRCPGAGRARPRGGRRRVREHHRPQRLRQVDPVQPAGRPGGGVGRHALAGRRTL
jgi:hypothetical protein